jgi:hypothetical protein
LVNVFFRGYGQWYYGNGSDRLNLPVAGNYLHSGCFRLTEDDEIAYHQMGVMPVVSCLLPAWEHPHCNFTMQANTDIETGQGDYGYDIERKDEAFFIIDRSYPIEILEIAKPPNTDGEQKDLSETERNTMLKLIIGMAIDAYDYDPGPDGPRNTATGGNKGSIKAALERCGLSADQKTIKKYLEEAAKQYPDAKAQKS